MHQTGGMLKLVEAKVEVAKAEAKAKEKVKGTAAKVKQKEGQHKRERVTSSIPKDIVAKVKTVTLSIIALAMQTATTVIPEELSLL